MYRLEEKYLSLYTLPGACDIPWKLRTFLRSAIADLEPRAMRTLDVQVYPELFELNRGTVKAHGFLCATTIQEWPKLV